MLYDLSSHSPSMADSLIASIYSAPCNRVNVPLNNPSASLHLKSLLLRNTLLSTYSLLALLLTQHPVLPQGNYLMHFQSLLTLFDSPSALLESHYVRYTL